MAIVGVIMIIDAIGNGSSDSAAPVDNAVVAGDGSDYTEEARAQGQFCIVTVDIAARPELAGSDLFGEPAVIKL